MAGYMMCWVAGQSLAKKFKTLVCHDGIFTMPSMLAADVSAGLELDVGSHYWDDMSKWDAQDPSRNVSKWTQPMLIIHSDLDYRCERRGSLLEGGLTWSQAHWTAGWLRTPCARAKGSMRAC
jgi:dipeptidyl aminopeptidase/acylaminoacyl peptidase